MKQCNPLYISGKDNNETRTKMKQCNPLYISGKNKYETM